MRRHDAAHRQLLHLLELRQQHGLRLTEASAEAVSLQELCVRARQAGSIALDCEFMSERRYWAQLCLVALAVEDSDGVEAAFVDTLAPVDASPLVALLEDPDVEVVVHAGEQDVALVKQAWRTPVTNVFDTQIAAAFAGATVNSSYGKLVRDVLGVDLPKGAGFTRWDRRPLSAEQLTYARNDVEHLPVVARVLRERLQSAGRLDWAREEFRRVEDASAERDPERAFRRLPGVNQLSASDRAVARELALWRERTAQAVDRPIRTVLSDVALVQIARERPREVGVLGQIRGVDGGLVRRHGNEVLAAISSGEQGPPLPREQFERPPDQVEALTALAEALLRSRALDEGIAPQLIGGRDDLAKVATAVLRGRSEPPVPVMSGWRREMVGNQLLELLRGDGSLSVDENGRVRARRDAR